MVISGAHLAEKPIGYRRAGTAGPKATERQVRLCGMSIKAQCFGPLLRERRRKASPGRPRPPVPPLLELDVAVLADHVTRFSGQAGKPQPRRRRSG